MASSSTSPSSLMACKNLGAKEEKERKRVRDGGRTVGGMEERKGWW